jgi:23S rRNA pseudouridine1911/1915/1917 synthase
MPRREWGWEITEEELRGWILYADDRLLVVNKPALVVCHPSKHGPWSSLIGACREYLGVERLHMPSRLDRETSGVVVLARDAELGSRLQRAIMYRQVEKTYYALLSGRLETAVTVDEPIGQAVDAEVIVRRAVRADGQAAVTRFEPVSWGAGSTLARIVPQTGRLHQIRVHAAWLGHAVLGDKIYGPDERLFLEFLQHGWTERHQRELQGWRHQALHAAEWKCERLGLEFRAPVPEGWGGSL